MNTKILFEDDDDDKAIGLKLKAEVKIKNEDAADENVCSSKPFEEEETNHSADTNSDFTTTTENDKIVEGNIIILGSRIPCEGNVTEDKEGQSNGKPKRKNQTELQMLGVDINNEENMLDGEYDVFGDESKIFRKYKLRKIEQTVSYTEPPDIKPKRYISSDDERDMTCPICQQELVNKVALSNHLRIHNKTVQEYTCSLCSKKFDKNADLIAHRKVHSSESFLCTECKLAFSDYCDFLLHNYEHMDKRYFNCPECGLRYRKSVYKKHILRHFDRKLSCHLCSFVTNGEFNLQKHINQHKFKFPCVECGKVYNVKKEFDYHMSIHTGVKTFQCLYCGACFRNNGQRKIHTLIHTDERPFTCDICGHKLRQWIDLKRHKLTHNTEKKYTCDLCGKKYLHKHYLTVHMRSHTKSSLYECPECDGKFVSLGGLKTHMMFKHTSERPVECAPCNKRFISNNQYRKHCRAKYHLRNMYGLKVNKDEENDE